MWGGVRTEFDLTIGTHRSCRVKDMEFDIWITFRAVAFYLLPYSSWSLWVEENLRPLKPVSRSTSAEGEVGLWGTEEESDEVYSKLLYERTNQTIPVRDERYVFISAGKTIKPNGVGKARIIVSLRSRLMSKRPDSPLRAEREHRGARGREKEFLSLRTLRQRHPLDRVDTKDFCEGGGMSGTGTVKEVWQYFSGCR